MTLRAQVELAIDAHRSGAIEVCFKSSGGESSVSWSKLDGFLETHLGDVKTSQFLHEKPDILVDSDKGVLHPMTEAGWDALESIHLEQPYAFFFKVNSQNASQSITNFQGLSSCAHDEDRITRDRARSEGEAQMGGYGLGRWS